ncbi:hypothetical protein HON22_02115 [Candidatus Peregrinibacteria bacterium]|jgi:antitoxin (DNA-binding transcriptional repressor) of toxin-antitoxin stability system|nr:hypothetical protein [Candidatus Peregrinibacteria bacterium]
MLTVSTKYLRNNLSNVLEKIDTGEIILLIHKSTPVAELRKPEKVKPFEATDENINDSALQDVSEDFLSKEELQYYLSLK